MNGGGGAGLQAQELSDWTLALLEKVHPQERLHPLRLQLILLHTNSTQVLIVWLIKRLFSGSIIIQNTEAAETRTMDDDQSLCSVDEPHGTRLCHCRNQFESYLPVFVLYFPLRTVSK